MEYTLTTVHKDGATVEVFESREEAMAAKMLRGLSDALVPAFITDGDKSLLSGWDEVRGWVAVDQHDPEPDWWGGLDDAVRHQLLSYRGGALPVGLAAALGATGHIASASFVNSENGVAEGWQLSTALEDWLVEQRVIEEFKSLQG